MRIGKKDRETEKFYVIKGRLRSSTGLLILVCMCFMMAPLSAFWFIFMPAISSGQLLSFNLFSWVLLLNWLLFPGLLVGFFFWGAIYYPYAMFRRKQILGRSIVKFSSEGLIDLIARKDYLWTDFLSVRFESRGHDPYWKTQPLGTLNEPDMIILRLALHAAKGWKYFWPWVVIRGVDREL